jgi:23S rRNA pseudouridine2605 synthase
MPPRYAYWTIIAGGLPTAFRMTEREELLPTFQRIKQKHPDAELKYFARGRLWSSPDEAKAETERVRAAADERRSTRRPSRGRDWRPGGEHQDPRQKFKDAKKARNQDRRQERFDRRHKPGARPSDSDASAPGDPLAARPARPEWRGRPPHGGGGGQGFRGKPSFARDRPSDDRGPRPPRPHTPGDRPWSARPPRAGAERGRPRDDRPRHDDRGGQGFRGKPSFARDRPSDDRGDRPFRGKPSTGDDRRPASNRPPPRSNSRPGAKPGGSSGSAKGKGSWARTPESKSRGAGPTSRTPGRPGKGRDQRGPAKDRRR